METENLKIKKSKLCILYITNMKVYVCFIMKIYLTFYRLISSMIDLGRSLYSMHLYSSKLLAVYQFFDGKFYIEVMVILEKLKNKVH